MLLGPLTFVILAAAIYLLASGSPLWAAPDRSPLKQSLPTPPIAPAPEETIVPQEEPEKPHLTSDNPYIAEITVEEFEAAKIHVQELEASYQADPITEVDQSACRPPATIQEKPDCGGHMLAGMIGVLECLEGNWGGNPYPWYPEFRASPLWFSSIDPDEECHVGFYQGLLDAKQYGVLTWDRLNYEEYHGDCHAAHDDIDSEDYAWAYPLRIEGFSIVYLWEKNNPQNNMGSRQAVIEAMAQGHSVGIGIGTEVGNHGVLVYAANQEGIWIQNSWGEPSTCFLTWEEIEGEAPYDLYTCRSKNYKLSHERRLESDR